MKKMRYKKGDKVSLNIDAKFEKITIPKGTIVEIIAKDLVFRTYDIDYLGVAYTDFRDTDFV